MMYLFAVIGYLWAFWFAYVLVMGLYRAHLSGRMSRVTYVLAAPALLFGVAMDVLANIFIASVIFLEFPREWLVTKRLQRHIKKGLGTWRGYLAAWVCTSLLDVFDPSGDHC